jgi:hypothetical protein
MQPFQVPDQTDQTPFSGCGGQAPQRELAKAEHLLDNADGRLDWTFAQAVNGRPMSVCSL